jgi:hypothetical protein
LYRKHTALVYGNNMSKKKVMLFSDHPFTHTGIASQCRSVAIQLLKNGYDVFVLAVLAEIPDAMSKNTIFKTSDGEIKVQITDKFENVSQLLKLLQTEKPDVLVLIQDPHYYYQTFLQSPGIRNHIPICFLHIWDTQLVPEPEGTPHYNLSLYECVDSIGTASLQTHEFVNAVLARQKYGVKPIVKYTGLGRDENIFKPLPEEEYGNLKALLTNGKEFDFIALVNNKNQTRKHIPDTVEAWRLFNESLTKQEADRTLLILHTQARPHHKQIGLGTDLNQICTALAPKCNIVLDSTPLNEEQLNQLYNASDVFINAASSEGFGLTSHEASLAGRPLIINNTGGLKDQSGNRKGEWCYVLKNHRTIIGSVATPYLYDEIAEIDDISNGFKYWYHMTREERNRRGLKGRQWCLSKGLTSEDFSKKSVDLINETLNTFKPRPLFNIYE